MSDDSVQVIKQTDSSPEIIISKPPSIIKTQINSIRAPSDPYIRPSQSLSDKIQTDINQNKPLSSEESAPPLQKRQFTEPEDVWLLCQKQKIANKIAFNHIIWIDEEKTYSELQKKISQFLPILYCTTVQDANNYIKQKLIKTVIIDPASLNKQTYQCLKLDAIKNIVLLKKLEQETDKRVEKLKQNKQSQQFIIIEIDQTKVEEAQSNIKKVLNEHKHSIELPSFIEVSIAKLLQFNHNRTSLYSIEQPIGNEQLAFRDFIELFSYIEIGTSLTNKLKSNKDKFKNSIEILREYTKETQFYRILNQCLKVIQNPLEAAWLRFPYSKMCQAIRQEFNKESDTSFVVYRGIYISEKEYQSLQQTKIYQNLGFLSTSLEQKIALAYAYNCIIKIKVNDPDKKSSGFCNLKDISSNPDQEEILFNTNNLFRLTNKGIYQQDKDKYLIQLEMINQPPKQLQASFLQHQNYRKLQQGGALYTTHPNLCIEYYENKRKLEIRKGIKNFTTQSNLAIVYQKQGFYEEALENYTSALAIQHQILGEKHIETAYTINNMAIVYQKQGLSVVAIEHYKKTLAICKQKFGEKHIYTAKTILSMASAYVQNGQISVGLNYFRQILPIYAQTYGQKHQQSVLLYYIVKILQHGLSK